MKEILHKKNSPAIFLPSFSFFATNVSGGNSQRTLLGEPEMISNQMGTQSASERLQFKGHLVCPPHKDKG
jgi:hypothetical protein